MYTAPSMTGNSQKDNTGTITPCAAQTAPGGAYAQRATRQVALAGQHLWIHVNAVWHAAKTHSTSGPTRRGIISGGEHQVGTRDTHTYQRWYYVAQTIRARI